MRRLAAIVAGLALVTSLALAGAGAASATFPAIHVTNGSKWKAIANDGCFEILTFASTGTFTGSRGHDKGTWSGGGKQLIVTWTVGKGAGLEFSLTYTKTPIHEYTGTYTYEGSSGPAALIEGASCSA